MMGMNNQVAGVFGGVAILGIVASCWRTVLSFITKLKSIFIVGFETNTGRGEEFTAIVMYLRQHYKTVGGKQWSYDVVRNYMKSKQRHALSPIKSFIAVNDVVVFYKKGSVLFVNCIASKGDRETNYTVKIWTFRFLLNPDNFFKNAINEFDSFSHEEKKKEGGRFFVATWNGCRGMDKSSDEPCGESIETSKDMVSIRSKFIPLGFDWDDIVQDSSSGKEIYSLASYLTTAYEEAKFWLERKDWYAERGITWKRGWLLVGKPGTGKTAFIRWLAKTLDMPIITFDLSTYTNRSFISEWSRINSRTPCFVLFEDIDAVYNGRENVTDTDLEKGVTFDCFINCLDGIKRNDGVFIVITSNKPETIDPAIGALDKNGASTRPGRIDRIIEILPLDVGQKTEIANNIFKGFEHLVPQAIELGKTDSGACFMDRCRVMAEKALWESEKRFQDVSIEPVTVIGQSDECQVSN